MSNTQCHTIRRQFLDVEIYGTESDGLTLQRNLPDLCYKWLMPAIEKALERHAPENNYLTIDRLDIDAGTVKLDRLEHDFPEMVAKVLEQYLQDISAPQELMPKNNKARRGEIRQNRTDITEKLVAEHLPQPEELSNVLERGNIQQKTEQQTITDAFIFFLKNGTLPWSFHLPSGSGFEELVQHSLKEPEGGGSTLELFKNEVIETLASAIARKRLVQQFTPVFLEVILELLVTEGNVVLAEMLSLFRSSDSELMNAKRLEQELWECAFACIASGNSLSEEYLKRELNTILTVSAVHDASPPLNSQPQQVVGGDDVKKVVDLDPTVEGALNLYQEALLKPQSADKKERGAHHDRTQFSSETTEGEQSPPNNNYHAQRRSTSASSSRQSDGPEEPTAAQHAKSHVKEPVSLPSIEHPDAKAGIYTALAGLVLLHPFLPQLFRALGFADDEKLLYPDKAVYLLYFLATGRTSAMEYELVIPKMLCHVPLASAVESNVSLLADEQEEAIALLAAVIHHWEVMKNTGADGLRETFLQRSGKLSQRDDGEWLLQVETNSFDILLEQLPWGISMIQLPWMPGMLRVEWV